MAEPSLIAGVLKIPAAALREVLRRGYTPAALRADLMAGMVVGVVALPERAVEEARKAFE